jgi:RimJ/RimL family protein N-acetyltransferase
MVAMTKPPEVLTGPRIVLRRWRADDAEEIRAAVAASMPRLRPWMPWAANDYGTREAAGFMAETERSWEADESYDYAITLAGAVVGAVGLMRSVGPGAFEIGYWVHVDHSGRGLVTEAVKCLVDQAFTMPGIERIQIWHDAANAASGGVPKRLGFTEIDRRTPPREPLTPAKVGVDVIWEMKRPGGVAAQPSPT